MFLEELSAGKIQKYIDTCLLHTYSSVWSFDVLNEKFAAFITVHSYCPM